MELWADNFNEVSAQSNGSNTTIESNSMDYSNPVDCEVLMVTGPPDDGSKIVELNLKLTFNHMSLSLSLSL